LYAAGDRPTMPSRRRLLTALGATALGALAGCGGSGSGSSSTIDCQTTAVEHGDGDVLDGGAMATVEDGDVWLAVPLAVADVRDHDIDALAVYHDDSLEHRIPVSADDADVMAEKPGVSEGQLRYEQTVGSRPQHGRYRIAAVRADGTSLDSVTVEFNCFSEGQ
jgi:hypothetical protein